MINHLIDQIKQDISNKVRIINYSNTCIFDKRVLGINIQILVNRYSIKIVKDDLRIFDVTINEDLRYISYKNDFICNYYSEHNDVCFTILKPYYHYFEVAAPRKFK